LLEAGTSPETAKKAAEELAGYENRFAGIESDLAVLKWMMGTLIVLSLGHLWLTFNILSRLPR
jgi:hypothetical protein